MALSQALSEEEFHRMQVSAFAVAFSDSSGVLMSDYRAGFGDRHHPRTIPAEPRQWPGLAPAAAPAPAPAAAPAAPRSAPLTASGRHFQLGLSRYSSESRCHFSARLLQPPSLGGAR